MLVYAAHPQSLLANPAVEMIKSIPSVWDETIVLPPSEIGDLAGTNGVFLHELATQSASLEEAFMELTRESVEFHAESFPLHEPVATAGPVSREES